MYRSLCIMHAYDFALHNDIITLFCLSLSLQWRAPWWSVAVSTMRRQSVRSLAFLQAEWMTMLTNWQYIRIDPPQPGGTWAPVRSPPMTGRSESCLNNPMVILLKVSTSHMPKEAEPSLLNKMGDWTTACGLPVGIDGKCLDYTITLHYCFILTVTTDTVYF